MFIITHVKCQKRVAVLSVAGKNVAGQSLSIPCDLPLKFHVKRRDGKCKTNDLSP